MDDHGATASRVKSIGKWGSSCANCASAKAKCMRSEEKPSGPCERCDRLSKPCTNQVHQPRKKRVGKPSRTTVLEERLNGLVDLLRASGELPADRNTVLNQSRDSPTPMSTAYDDSLSPGITSGSRASSSLPRSNSHHTISPASSIHIPPSYNSYAPPRCLCRSEVGEVPLQTQTDENLLELYQTRLMPDFPFVTIPRDTLVSELQKNKPFLLSAICMVASVHEQRSMRGQMFALIEHFYSQVMIKGEKSLDILQGLVVALGWYHHHCMIHTQLSNLIYLAQSLTADLELNREPEVLERTSVWVLNPEKKPPRTNEERRALLGVWYLSSAVSVGLGRIQSMKFSKYLRRCLQELETQPDFASDPCLVYIVKIQRLTEQIHAHNRKNDDDDEVELPGLASAPLSSYQSAYQYEIDCIRTSMPDTLRDNKYVQTHLKAASLHLFEPPKIDSECLSKLSESLSHNPDTLNSLYRSKNALQEFCDHFLALPTASYPYFNIAICMDWVYSVIMLARWAKLMGPGRLPQPDDDEPMSGDGALTPQKPFWDPSARRPQHIHSFGAGLAPAPEYAENHSSSKDGKRRKDAVTQQVTAQQVEEAAFRETADPRIPASVAALKAKLHQQLILQMDIIQILSQLAQRFKEAQDHTVEEGDGKWRPTIWDLSYKKLLITRAKLEKWAEIIAARTAGNHEMSASMAPVMDLAKQRVGIDAAEDNDARSRNPITTDPVEGRGLADKGSQSIFPQQNIDFSTLGGTNAVAGANLMGWAQDDVWTTSVFDQLDPGMWSDMTSWFGPVPASTDASDVPQRISMQ